MRGSNEMCDKKRLEERANKFTHVAPETPNVAFGRFLGPLRFVTTVTSVKQAERARFQG